MSKEFVTGQSTGLHEEKKFTIADAMNIQKQHMNFWKTILKPEYYSKVEKKVELENDKGYANPYQVCRGTHIDNIVANILRD